MLSTARSSRRWRFLPLLLLLIPISCATHRDTAPLRVTFLDVGQGDSAVIEAPTGEVAVIDGGGIPGTNESWGDDPGHRTVVPFLRARGVRQINLLVASHPDDDHVQGLIAVVDNFPVRAVLVNGQAAKSGAYRRLIALVQAKRIPLITGRRGQSLLLGVVRVSVLAPGDSPQEGLLSDNNQSLVLNVQYGSARVLFTGDAEAQEESRLLEAGADARADVLKLGHHGSRFSSTPRFLQTVHTRLAIVSAGRNNRYGHPASETLARLQAQNIRFLRTDKNGGITLETDGKRIRVTPTLK